MEPQTIQLIFAVLSVLIIGIWQRQQIMALKEIIERSSEETQQTS